MRRRRDVSTFSLPVLPTRMGKGRTRRGHDVRAGSKSLVRSADVFDLANGIPLTDEETDSYRSTELKTSVPLMFLHRINHDKLWPVSSVDRPIRVRLLT